MRSASGSSSRGGAARTVTVNAVKEFELLWTLVYLAKVDKLLLTEGPRRSTLRSSQHTHQPSERTDSSEYFTRKLICLANEAPTVKGARQRPWPPDVP